MVVVSSCCEAYGSVLQRTKPPSFRFGVPLREKRTPWKETKPENGFEWGRRQILMALMGWANSVLQWRLQWEAMVQAGARPQQPPSFGSRVATHPREGGMKSNRGVACRGEPNEVCCTYSPSRPEWLGPLKTQERSFVEKGRVD